MTIYARTSLKTFFETGDVPTGTNYGDLIDSCVNMGETAVQVMSGSLNPTELITPRVSATNGVFTGTLSVAGIFSAATMNADSLTLTSINVQTVTGSAASFTTDISASGTVYASAVRSTNGFIGGAGIVSAAGTTQGTAAPLTFVVNRGKGIADGTTTGFAPLANRTGLVQYLYNEGASANLWPPTGGFINGLAVNTPFPLAASAMVTIVHLTASAYGVK